MQRGLEALVTCLMGILAILFSTVLLLGVRDKFYYKAIRMDVRKNLQGRTRIEEASFLQRLTLHNSTEADHAIMLQVRKAVAELLSWNQRKSI